MKSNISNEIDAANIFVQYDEHVKRILSNRYILAWILKSLAEELEGLSVTEIAEECIDKEIYISQIPIHSGLSNQYQKSDRNKPLPETIIGDNTEDSIPYEGKIAFDIRFHAAVPGNINSIKLLVNVEAQKAYYQKYDMVTRGIFYGARMISAQMDREFRAPYYNEMRKVYSIWICMNMPDYMGNTITQYKITKQDLEGKTQDKKESYDKMSILIIGLNKKIPEEKGIVRLLSVLLSAEVKTKVKKDILSSEYGISMEDSLGEELDEMCNLSQAIEEQGIEKGIEKGVQALIETCMDFSATRKETRLRIIQKFSVTEEKADVYLKKYWI